MEVEKVADIDGCTAWLPTNPNQVLTLHETVLLYATAVCYCCILLWYITTSYYVLYLYTTAVYYIKDPATTQRPT